MTYTALGPVDITRGTVGLGVRGAQSAAGRLRRRNGKGKLAKELGAAQETLAQELAAAQQVVAGLPQAYAQARQPRRRRLVWFIAAGVVTLAGGAVAFSIIRRSMGQEPSPRPPSVDIAPKP
jgi:Cell wall synthesis protein CwsA